jgi:biotin/methionine sulfoxide reductase
LVYWAGGNPFHHHQDLNRLREAWQRPETIIVHEWCWNALAKHADLVLPCTTSFERQDLAMSPRDYYVMSMEQAIDPVGESRDDYDILAAISRHMGVEEKFTEGRSSEDWQRNIYTETQKQMVKDGFDFLDYDDFREKRWFTLKTESHPKILFEDFRRDPEANRLNTPSGKIELYSSTIAEFGYDDAPPHAAWLTPPEWLGQNDPTYPLHLLCNQPKTKLHSQLDHGKISRAAKIKGHECIYLNPEDARKRGITAGDLVRVFNDRGDCVCGAIITATIRPGVVLIPTGAWFDPDDHDRLVSCKHGNPNVLTPDRGTSRLAQGPAAHSCLVDMEKWHGEALSVTAFDPPAIKTP